MANLMDYLDWRGDLTLDQDPFNEVDNLILAELSFVDFGGIVPPPGKGGSVPLCDAAEAFFRQHPEGEPIEMGVLVPDEIPDMLRKMASSPRFGGMRLGGFADWLDEGRGEQFAALTVETGDGRLYLSFRGTDDSLAGWQEDFYLAFMPQVPAQAMAVQYVRDMAPPDSPREPRLGGHSKGGNLAVYAAVQCPAAVQRRIESVWSNDGPGFHEDFLELPQHRRIAERIISIVPKSSVVGMLLEHEEDYTVVDSDQLGLLQHDGFSWQVMGRGFVTLGRITRQAQLSDTTLRQWLRGMSTEQREKFVHALFTVLKASGAATLTDLKAESFKAVGPMVKAMKDLDKETRDGLLDFVRMLFMSNLRLTLEGIQEENEKRAQRRRKKREEKNG